MQSRLCTFQLLRVLNSGLSVFNKVLLLLSGATRKFYQGGLKTWPEFPVGRVTRRWSGRRPWQQSAAWDGFGEGCSTQDGGPGVWPPEFFLNVYIKIYPMCENLRYFILFLSSCFFVTIFFASPSLSALGGVNVRFLSAKYIASHIV